MKGGRTAIINRLGTSSVIGIGFSFPSSQTQTATFRIREGTNSHASRARRCECELYALKEPPILQTQSLARVWMDFPCFPSLLHTPVLRYVVAGGEGGSVTLGYP